MHRRGKLVGEASRYFFGPEYETIVDWFRPCKFSCFSLSLSLWKFMPRKDDARWELVYFHIKEDIFQILPPSSPAKPKRNSNLTNELISGKIRVKFNYGVPGSGGVFGVSPPPVGILNSLAGS